MASPHPDRSRILTLVFTDLADSTALKFEQGDARGGDLIASHRRLVAHWADECGGRVVDWAGDGCFLTFEATSAAVRFALHLQEAHGSEPDLPSVRAGIHIGEVTETTLSTEDDAGLRVEGLAVDLAARIASLAKPGQVLLSSSVYQSARPRLDPETFARPVRWQIYGLYVLKGFDQPVEIAEAGLEGLAPFTPPKRSEKAAPRPSGAKRVLFRTGGVVVIAGIVFAVVLAVSWPRPMAVLADMMGATGPPTNPPLPDRPSLAVLPFKNLSADTDVAYFAEGLTEELIAGLGKFEQLFVTARNSSFHYQDAEKDAYQQIGQDLGVRYIVVGSVQRMNGPQVKVTAHLVNAEDDRFIWTHKYERSFGELFDLQTELAQEILDRIGVHVDEAERERSRRKPPTDLTAYDLYLRSEIHFNRFTQEDHKRARQYAEQALERDEIYADVLALLGNLYIAEYVLGWNNDPTLIDRAEEFIERALELNRFLPRAHTSQALIYMARGELQAAIESTTKAVEAAPNSENCYGVRAIALASDGQFIGAMDAVQKALRLNPRQPSNFWMLAGFINWRVGRVDRAVELWERVRKANPEMILPRLQLIVHYERSGKHEQAKAIGQEILAINPEFDVEYALHIAPLQGDRDAFIATLTLAGIPDGTVPPTGG